MNVMAATDTKKERLVQLTSEVLGDLELPESALFDFPLGLYGFDDTRQFALLPAERDGLFWLQSVEYSALTFLLADPFRWVTGYNVEIEDAELALLDPEEEADVAVLAIVTLPRTREEQPTVNLQGPLALNIRKRVGRQLVTQDSPFDVRQPLDLAGPGDAGD